MAKVNLEGTSRKATEWVYVAVADIKPNPYNPNRQTESEFELLCRSIEEDGFTVPVIVTQDMVIVDGEHRWTAAQELGIKQIPAKIVEMTPAEMRIATMRHNMARGTEDIELSGKLMSGLTEDMDWVQDSLMIDDVERDLLLMDSWQDAPLAVTGDVITPQQVADRRVKEREMVHQVAREDAQAWDENVYHLAILYTAEEAEMVRRVIGERQAVAILKLCKWWKEKQDAA